MTEPQTTSLSTRNLEGFLFAIAAFFLWGILPIYWKLLKTVPPQVILCHRIIWSSVFLAFIVSQRKGWRKLRGRITSPQVFPILTASTLLIAINWWLYIWAVNSGFVLE